MAKKRVLLATSPFASTGREPLEILEREDIELIANPFSRRLKAGEVANYIRDVDAVIAGTEPYTAETLADAKHLKLISRVGIGLDSVDLAYCRERGIRVAYTPDAPTRGVAEMTVAFILCLLREINASDTSVRMGAWNRLMGRLVGEVKIGLIGMGRIGGHVAELLQTFQPSILAYDIDPKVHGRPLPNVEWMPLEQILEECDLLSLHFPMNERNRHVIGRAQIAKMKTGAIIVNTARGGVLDETALTDALQQKHLGGAALDVFEKEPYEGPLTRMDNVILTAHMGASARGSRFLMELGAAQQCIDLFEGRELTHDAIVDTFGERT